MSPRDERSLKTTHSSVGTLPHLFEVILLNTGFIWCNGRTFDAYSVLEDGMGSFNRYLIVCLQINGEQCR